MICAQPAPATVFHALADPTRFAIVERLSRGSASVSELAKPFKISLMGVVQHVQALENAGLITTQKRGRTRECRINLAGLSAVERWIAERRQFWEQQFDQLATALDKESEKEEHAR